MFAKRIFLYLIGFFFGSVLVYLLFYRSDGHSFLPSSIVLDTLKSKEFIFEKKAECQLLCFSVVKGDIKKLLKDADVNFSESRPHDNPKKYVIEIKSLMNEKVKLTVELNDTNAKIVSADMPEAKQTCNCD